MVKDPKKAVEEIAKRVGKHEAQSLLVGEGVSTSTAQKLVSNRYTPEIGELILRAISRALEKAKEQEAS